MQPKIVPEWSYVALKGIFKAILKMTYTVESHGLKNLEALSSNQGFILAANHGSIVDAFVMGLEISSHQVRFVGRQRTLWSNPVFGKINDIIKTIPVPESKNKDKSSVIKTSVNAVREGAVIGIYPEGAILNRRKNFSGKTGTVRIALEAGVPIIPVGLLGTDGLWPYGAKMPRLGRVVKMYIGDPLWFDNYFGHHENWDVVRYVTDVMMKEIRKESGWYDVPPEEVRKYYPLYENLVKPVI